MRDYLEIGPSPCDEPCTQAGEDPAKERAQCKRFIDCIRKALGPEPEGARLAVKGFEHADFGTYYEVVCWYDDRLPASVDYAFKCEGEAPTKWSTN